MARSTYGGSIADTVQAQGPGGTITYAATTLSIWSDRVGGTHYTDLVLDGAAASSIPVGVDGQIPEFQAPDGVNDGVYIDALGALRRVLLLPRGGGGGGGVVDPGSITVEDVSGLDAVLEGYQLRDDNAVTGSQAGIEIVIDDGATDPDALPSGHVLAPASSRLLLRPVSAPATRKAVTIETDGTQGSVDVSSLGGSGGSSIAPTPIGDLAFPRVVTTAASDIYPASGTATFFPIDLGAGTYDAIAVYCVGARAGGTIDGRIALYGSTSEGLPDTAAGPLLTAQILTTTVTGIKITTLTPVTLTAGRYWTCSYMTESSTPTTKPTFTCITSRGLVLPQSTFGPSGDPAAVSSLQRTGLAASTLPTTASTVANLSLGTANKHPVIAVRRSA